MKKPLLIIFFTFLFLFIPKDTFAKSLSMRPTWYQYYNNNSMVSDGAPAGWTLYGNNYDTFSVGSSNQSVSKINWIYTNKWTQELNKGYDVSFKIYQPNIAVSNLNGFNAGKPLVSLENKSCFVDYTSSSSTGSATYGATFNVYCPNVTFSSTTFHVYVDSAPNNSSQTLFGVRYGISQTWDISLTNDNSNIQSSIDKNTQEQEETNEKLDDIKDSITDSDTSSSSSTAGGFFEGFEDNEYGLSDIITMPLEFIKGLSDSSCYSLELPLPFVEQNVQIPCMTTIYQNYFGTFLTLYQTITTGFISYWVCVNIYGLVKGFKDPDSDKVEVMDL